MGLSCYDKRFIKDYAQISYPLVFLLKGNKKFTWTTAAQQAFEHLKIVLTSAPLLALPNFQQELIVETNAFGIGIGVVLMQNTYPIAYISNVLSLNISLYNPMIEKCLLSYLL